MSDVLTAVTLQAAMTQQKTAVSMIKQAAQMQNQLVDMVAQTAQAITASPRGGMVDLSA